MTATYAVTQYVGGRLREVIQEGFPEVGWSGDPLLVPEFDSREEVWYIRDHAFTPPTTIIRKPSEGLRDLDFRSLCERLRDAQVKGQGTQTIAERNEARNQAIIDEGNREIQQLSIDTAHELYATSLHRRFFV